MMHLAMFDAATSLTSIGAPYVARYPPQPQRDLPAACQPRPRGRHRPALGLPAQSFDSTLANAPKGSGPVIEPGPDGFDNLGGLAAQGVINARSGDGSADTTAYVVQNVPGQWRPTGSGSAVSPNWGKVRPFADWSGGAPTPPPVPPVR